MLFYNFVIFLYWCSIQVSSLFHKKARKWISGRKNSFHIIEQVVNEKHIKNNAIWFHCASLGEFEQGRPLIESLKISNPKVKIVLTFFSPSGYEIRKNYEYADAIFYLPIDFKSNAKRFIKTVSPKAAVFVKYEFWLNYLAQLKKQKIPTYLVSAVFRTDQHFFKWYGRLFFNSLTTYRKLFLQDEGSFKLLTEKGLTNIEVAGDTRFDRVFEIAGAKVSLPLINNFCNNHKTLVAGSTWPKDEEIVLEAYKRLKEKYVDLKLIIAPHEVSTQAITRIEKLADTCRCAAYTTNGEKITEVDILIIDTIGILSQLYRYAIVSYIGGGFNDGIHNILEALVYNIPVAFGSNHHKFIEASETLKINITKEIHTASDLIGYIDKVLSDENYRVNLNQEIKKYMKNKSGATKKIISELNTI